MPDYLATKDWKAVLDLKENKAVKKTGVSETLDDYASARKKNDIGKMVSALERIVQKATEIKARHKGSIETFLIETIKAAKTEQQKLAVQANPKDEGEDNEDSTLGKGLTRLKQVQTLDAAWNFILVPGKPSSGFVVSKKPIKKENMVKAFEMRGKRAPYFTGRIFFEGGRYVLQLEDKPLPGLAKAAKGAATLHAEMTAKFVVRGAGVELDSDTDIDLMEEGAGPTGPEHLRDEGRFSTYQGRVNQLETVVAKFETSPNAKAEGAGDGILGAIKVLRGHIEGDPALTENMKDELLSNLDAYVLRMNEAAAPVAENPAAKYPDKAYWVRLGEAIIRLEPNRRDAAWEKYSARLNEVKLQFASDNALVDPARTQVKQVLDEAAELLKTAERQTVGLFEQGNNPQNSELAARMKGLERRYDQMIGTEGLNPQHVENVGKAYRVLRAAFVNGDLTLGDLRIGQVEQALETMAQRAFAKKQENAKALGQQQIHDVMTGSMEFMQRASIPTGLIKDPTAIRDQIQTNPDLGGMITAMTKATKTPGKEGGAEMEKTARALLAKVDPTSDLGQLAAQVLARGTMMRMVAEYQALGNPPWDPAKADTASELQSQLFFLEGTILNGGANYEAPRLGGDSGASGSWWIERQEPGKPGEKPAGKKKYIFKPGKEEASIMAGLLPGSGAPREVLAKRLDEMMSGAGFDVGVSPTTLARIDTAQLGDMDGPGGPQLGSMQQLAPSDGSIGDRLEDLREFSKTIDKKSFDDNAVFDMLYANLDRHAKNMLFSTDPVTGQTKMVPIDHGSALPDPEALQCNNASLMPGFNIMASPDMVPAQQPLGDETVEALLRLDPAKMVQDMKQSRDDLANRHPETAGLMSDEAIDAMAARVHFVRAAAAAKVPVAEIFQMLALGALRIAKASPQDMAGLVVTLRKEVADFNAGKDEADLVWTAFDEKGPGDRDLYLIIGVLNELGWGWALSKTAFYDWVNDNPKLVARVVKTRTVNPAILQEINRLLPLARAKVPDIETRAAGKDLVGQYNLYFETANAEMLKDKIRNDPLDSLKNAFQQLGGLDELKKAATVFPGDVVKWLADPAPDDGENRQKNTFAGRVAALRQWAEFQKEGGMAEILRLGGTIRRETNIKDGIVRLAELKGSQAVTKDLMDLDEEEMNERIAREYSQQLSEISDLVNTLRNDGSRQQLMVLRDKGIVIWQDGNAGGAVAMLSRALKLGRDRMADQVRMIKDAEDRQAAVRTQYDLLEQGQKQQMQPHMQGIYDLFQDTITTCSLNGMLRAENTFKYQLDIVEKGDESDYRKAEAGLNLFVQELVSHAGKPWHGVLNTALAGAQTNLAEFNVKSATDQLVGLREKFNAMRLFLDAVGDTDLRNAPQGVSELLEEWKNRIPNSSGLQQAPEAANRLRQLLAAPVDN